MSQKAEVKYDPAYLMPNQIANRISELGYEATVLESETSGQHTVDLLVKEKTLLFLIDNTLYVYVGVGVNCVCFRNKLKV